MSDVTEPTAVVELDRAWGADPDASYATLVALGSEHLRGGNLAEAQAALERADVLRPGSAQVQNLLGLTTFKLGDLDRALQIFESLHQRYPTEGSISLNLALVLLKRGQLEEARDRLLAVLERTPEHQRAANYLGLVYEQLEQFQAAARSYEQARNFKAAEVALRRHTDSLAQDTGAAQAALAPASAPVITEPQQPAQAPAVDAVGEALRAGEPATATVIEVPEQSPPLPSTMGNEVIDLADVAPVESSDRITLLDGMALLRIDGKALVRAERWVGRFGDLVAAPVFRRQRGVETEDTLGGRRPLVGVDGNGTALLRVDEKTAVTARFEEELFVVEPRLLALLGDSRHETGEVAMPDGTILPLLRLRGEGRVVLTADRRPARLKIALGMPVVVLASSLIAFAGKVLPRIAAPGPRSADAPPMLHLLGEGEVWVDGGSMLSFEMRGAG